MITPVEYTNTPKGTHFVFTSPHLITGDPVKMVLSLCVHKSFEWCVQEAERIVKDTKNQTVKELLWE